MPPPESDPDVSNACAQAAAAFDAFSRLPPDSRAAILDSIAAALDARREEILRVCSDETALTIEELTPEFARMTGTLRMFAGVVREGSWVRAAIDTPTTSPIGPNHDIRKMLVPLGPVAVFGSSNFPLAYGVYGGDTASALAAGCPVIVKEHPAHPRTGRLLAEIAQAAIRHGGFGNQLLGYVQNENPADLSVAQELVRNEHVVAVGFTGSIPGGRAVEKLARERDVPIPVFAELGSSNIVLITRSAAASRGPEIIRELARSIAARFGQQCTNTGLLIIDRAGASRTQRTPDPLIDLLTAEVTALAPRVMLSERVRRGYTDRLDDLDGEFDPESIVRRGAQPPANARCSTPAVVWTDLAEMDASRFRDEIFGPACIVLHGDLDDPRTLNELLFGLNEDQQWGQLVSCIHLGAVPRRADIAAAETLRRVCGRLVFNGVPTGVRVATSMVHGGPYPATNRPDTTAVGPLAIERWCRPVCFQNCPDTLLPPELKNANPRGIWRTLNGVIQNPRGDAGAAGGARFPAHP